METNQNQMVKPLKHNNQQLSLQRVNQKVDVWEAFSSKYIEQLDAVAVGELDNQSDKRNAAVTLSSAWPDQECRHALILMQHCSGI